jgi:hypothetical protein
MERSFIASIKKIEGSVENCRCVEILLQILTGQKVKQFVLFPRAADVSPKNLAGIAEVFASGKAGPACGFVAKVAEELTVQVIGGGLGDYIHLSGGSQTGRKREQRLLDPDLLNTAHRDIRRGGAHGFVSDVDTIHQHPGSAAVASNNGGRRMAALRRREHLAVELLDSGLKPGQIQKSSVRRNLFELRAINHAAHFRILGVDHFGHGRDHAHQLDVAGGGRCRLDPDQNVGRLKPFRLHM